MSRMASFVLEAESYLNNCLLTLKTISLCSVTNECEISKDRKRQEYIIYKDVQT